jgi:hypothetical protein
MIPVKLSSSAIEPNFNKVEFKSLKDEMHFEQHISSNYVESKKSLSMSNSKFSIDDFYDNNHTQDEPRNCCCQRSWVSCLSF